MIVRQRVRISYYMRVQSNVGWLKRAFDKTIAGYSTADFLEVINEIGEYLPISNYEVVENRKLQVLQEQ